MRTRFLMAGLLLLAAPAQAADDHPRSTYVTLVLQAFAAKVQCPGTDVVYQDLVQKAQQMQLPDGTTEQVRKAIAFMHTGGKMGVTATRTASRGVRCRPRISSRTAPRPATVWIALARTFAPAGVSATGK